jgi:hypothetical protein
VQFLFAVFCDFDRSKWVVNVSDAFFRVAFDGKILLIGREMMEKGVLASLCLFLRFFSKLLGPTSNLVPITQVVCIRLCFLKFVLLK